MDRTLRSNRDEDRDARDELIPPVAPRTHMSCTNGTACQTVAFPPVEHRSSCEWKMTPPRCGSGGEGPCDPGVVRLGQLDSWIAWSIRALGDKL